MHSKIVSLSIIFWDYWQILMTLNVIFYAINDDRQCIYFFSKGHLSHCMKRRMLINVVIQVMVALSQLTHLGPLSPQPNNKLKVVLLGLLCIETSHFKTP